MEESYKYDKPASREVNEGSDNDGVGEERLKLEDFKSSITVIYNNLDCT